MKFWISDSRSTILTETVNFTEGMIKFAEHLETANDAECILLITAMIKDIVYEIKKLLRHKAYCAAKPNNPV